MKICQVEGTLVATARIPGLQNRRLLVVKERGSGEVTKQERYAARPSLEEIFTRNPRDAGITAAVNRWGYRLKEVGDYLALHYSRVSRIASQQREKAKSKS